MGIIKKNKWFIAYKRRGVNLFDLSGLTIVEPPQDTYMADPFVLDGYFFYEWYDYNKGKIACSIIEDGKMTPPITVLEKSWHLSFPSVVKLDGEYYMTPEQGSRLQIFKAKQFPFKWEILTEIATGNFADPVLYKEDGWYKIYVTVLDNAYQIYRTRDLLGSWELDTGGGEDCRAAGHPFELGGLVRPIQECHQSYGRAILFQRNGKTFKTLEPDWFPGITATHTFNFNDKYVVIDGKIPL
jgi:hypothetical protein